MNKSKGFTIIELIVVIAIIAVLAAIVLVNVTSYIAKGKVAAIKGNLATLVTNAAAYYDTHSSAFNGFETDTTTGCGSTSPINIAISNAAGSLWCKVKTSDNSAWCGCSSTPGSTLGNSFCVDSGGVKKDTSLNCATACTTTNGICL